MEKKSKKSKNRTNDLVDDGDGDHHLEVDGGLPKKKGHKQREKKKKPESNEDGDEDQHVEGKLNDDGDLLKKDKKKRKRDSSESDTLSEKTQIEENEQSRDSGLAVEKDCDPKLIKEKKRKHKHHGQERMLENEKEVRDEVVDGKEIAASMEGCEEDTFEEIDEKKKKKKKKKTEHQDSDAGISTEELGNEGSKRKKKSKSVEKVSEERDSEGSKGKSVEDDTFEKFDKKKKKKKKTEHQVSDVGITSEELGNEGSKRKKKSESVGKDSEERDSEGSKGKKKMENNTEKPKAKSKKKKVSFSGHVEVFPSETDKQKRKGDGLLRGKRFTPEEDEIVKQAVFNYIEAHGLGDEGLKMVMNCRSHKGMKKCWQEIGTCLPHRPYSAIYYRAHILFERGEKRTWSPEELEYLKQLHEEHGNSWKKMAEEMGKHRFHVKDTWRRIKLKNRKGGKWNQEEYQTLYDLVNLDLQMKMSCEERDLKHGMLRDNIPWTAISEKLTTRSDATCCVKWYNQLTSSLVAEKKWADADDYRLIGALYELDAACVEDVDWDNLLPHRPGEVCRKRWDQMVHHIGHQGSQPFADQVDTLAKRYRPDLADTREAWDNKPVAS